MKSPTELADEVLEKALREQLGKKPPLSKTLDGAADGGHRLSGGHPEEARVASLQPGFRHSKGGDLLHLSGEGMESYRTGRQRHRKRWESIAEWG